MLNSRTKSRGMALAQVLVMSVIISLIAGGLIRTLMMDYSLVHHTIDAAQSRYWMEACLAQKAPLWQSGPGCGGNACCGANSDSCTFVRPGQPNMTVAISCSGSPQKVQFTVQW